jgi:hypothetical protein
MKIENGTFAMIPPSPNGTFFFEKPDTKKRLTSQQRPPETKRSVRRPDFFGFHFLSLKLQLSWQLIHTPGTLETGPKYRSFSSSLVFESSASRKRGSPRTAT